MATNLHERIICYLRDQFRSREYEELPNNRFCTQDHGCWDLDVVAERIVRLVKTWADQ